MINVVPMENTPGNFEFSLAVKKEAFGPHIVKRWGWDEQHQRETHSERWAARRFFQIVLDGDSIGTVSLDESPSHVTLSDFYILSPFHRRGIGTEVLAKILSEASARGLPVRLQRLKWNPAFSLYKRHGFVVTGETDTHFQMERASRDS